jgi:hypothetical protein
MVKLTKNAAAGGTYDNDDDAAVSDDAFLNDGTADREGVQHSTDAIKR